MPIFWILLSLAALAPAEELAGVEMPDEITVRGKTLTLNGMAIRTATIFNVDVYVAGLYLEKETSRAEDILRLEQPIRIHMEYLRSVGQRDIAEAWEESFEDYGELDPEDYRERLEELFSWLPSMSEGETTTFTYVPEPSLLSVEVNGDHQGNVTGQDFAKAFFRVWFADDVSYPDLRDGLLGKAP